MTLNRVKSGMSTVLQTISENSFILKNPDFPPGPKNLRSNLIPRASFNSYIEGNFRFVYKNCSQLNPKQRTDVSDYLFLHSFFPESPPKLDLLFCVETDRTDDFVCPVCQFTPVAPRMTHCGHICCEDCLHQLFQTTGKHLCPFCSEVIVLDETVRTLIHYRTNNKVINFTKCHRNRICTICSPSETSLNFLPTSSSALSHFSRFSFADFPYIKSVLEDEIASLQTQLIVYSEYDCPQKISSIQTVLSKIQAEYQTIVDDHSQFQISFPPDKSEEISFYLESNGRLVIMDRVNVTMLLTEFGSLEKCPNNFEAPVLSFTETTIDASNHGERSEFWHLACGAEVKIAFLDLSKVVSQKTLNQFKLSIRLHTMKQKKRITEGPVISESDFQYFEPIEIEPEANLKSEIDFPELNSNAKPRKIEEKKKVDDFPALGSNDDVPPPNKKPKPKSGWGNVHI